MEDVTSGVAGGNVAPGESTADAPLVFLQPAGSHFDPEGVGYATADDRGGRIILERGDAVELHRLGGNGAAPQVGFVMCSTTCIRQAIAQNCLVRRAGPRSECPARHWKHCPWCAQHSFLHSKAKT